MSIINYIIADDHKIFREGLKYAISDDPKLSLVGEAENGKVLLKLLEKIKADVVLLDIKMPEMDGIETTMCLHEKYPHIKILMLTSFDDEHFIIHLLEHGANGYLLKNAEPDEIKKAIHTVYNNDYYFNHLVSKTMLKSITKDHNGNAKLKNTVNLNERELEVLKLVCQEMTNAEIAAEIFLSPRTIEGIRKTLIEKIGVRNTAGLVLYAIKNGIIS